MSRVTYIQEEGVPTRVVVEMTPEDAAYVTALLGQTFTATSYELFDQLARLGDAGKIAKLRPIEGYGTGGLFPFNIEHFREIV